MDNSHEVVIVGGGPTGMMLAGELALAGVEALVLERRLTPEIEGSRAGGIHSRTIEVFDQRGIADRFLKEGKTAQVGGFGSVRLDISDFPTRHPYGLALWQRHIERILLGWVTEFGVTVERGREVVGLDQDDSGVRIRLAGGSSIRSQYLVGCDGGRSTVRKAAGIGFPGFEPTVSHLIAEVEMSEEPEMGMRNNQHGLHGISRMEDGRIRVMMTEATPGNTADATLRDLSEALVAAYGTDFGVHSPTWLSRFTDAARQADRYREGRVLVAGDAAHIHYPAGGQGLSLGIQDAVNLGWKLAQVVKGTSGPELLDTYQAERHPIAARVLRDTLAQVAMRRTDERSLALNGIVADLLAMDEPRKVLAGRMSGLAIRYELGDGHPLLGRRVPDLDIVTASGPLRVYELLHEARPVLLNLAGPGAVDIGPWVDRVQLVEATCAGPWELPVIGPVPAPAGVLVRPDGYVAWVGNGDSPELQAALARWFGPPRA